MFNCIGMGQTQLVLALQSEKIKIKQNQEDSFFSSCSNHSVFHSKSSLLSHSPILNIRSHSESIITSQSGIFFLLFFIVLRFKKKYYAGLPFPPKQNKKDTPTIKRKTNKDNFIFKGRLAGCLNAIIGFSMNWSLIINLILLVFTTFHKKYQFTFGNRSMMQSIWLAR